MRPLLSPIAQTLLLDRDSNQALHRFITAPPDERDEVVIGIFDDVGERHNLSLRFMPRPYWG